MSKVLWLLVRRHCLDVSLDEGLMVDRIDEDWCGLMIPRNLPDFLFSRLLKFKTTFHRAGLQFLMCVLCAGAICSDFSEELRNFFFANGCLLKFDIC